MRGGVGEWRVVGREDEPGDFVAMVYGEVCV